MSAPQCKIQLNRKVLSELAIHEPKTFAALAGIAKQRWKYGVICYLHEDPFNLELVSKFPASHYQKCAVPSTAKLYKMRELLMEEEHTTSKKEDKENVVLYQTRRVPDERTGQMVMETAV